MCPVCLRTQAGRRQVVRVQDRVFCVGPLVSPGRPAGSLPPGQPDPRLGVLSLCLSGPHIPLLVCSVHTGLAWLCLCSV